MQRAALFARCRLLYTALALLLRVGAMPLFSGNCWSVFEVSPLVEKKSHSIRCDCGHVRLDHHLWEGE
jgi:hypothetical protein